VEAKSVAKKSPPCSDLFRPAVVIFQPAPKRHEGVSRRSLSESSMVAAEGRANVNDNIDSGTGRE